MSGNNVTTVAWPNTLSLKSRSMPYIIYDCFRWRPRDPISSHSTYCGHPWEATAARAAARSLAQQAARSRRAKPPHRSGNAMCQRQRRSTGKRHRGRTAPHRVTVSVHPTLLSLSDIDLASGTDIAWFRNDSRCIGLQST